MMDMTLTPAQTGTGLQGPTGQAENSGPKYPPGLQLCLDSDTLKKLAMGLPQVGDTFTLDGLVEVVSVSKRGTLIEDNVQVCLQVTALALEEPDERNEQQKAHDQISAMYGNS